MLRHVVLGGYHPHTVCSNNLVFSLSTIGKEVIDPYLFVLERQRYSRPVGVKIKPVWPLGVGSAHALARERKLLTDRRPRPLLLSHTHFVTN